MLDLSTSPLIQHLQQLSPTALQTAANEHALWNLPELVNATESHHLLQKHKNILFLDEFKQLNTAFEVKTKTSLTPLKGLSLLTKLYENTLSRPMTDMDIYTHLPESVFTEILINSGYLPVSEIKWHFNKHKHVFIKKHLLMDITCEIHTDLVPRNDAYSWKIDSQGNLNTEEEFLYLCYHWAEQHTCLKLFWLFDLYYFAQKNALDSNELWRKADSLQIHSSLIAAHWALKNCFQFELLRIIPLNATWKSYALKMLLTPHLLVNIHHKRWTYLALKHLLKDGIHKQFIYNFLWLRHKLKK